MRAPATLRVDLLPSNRAGALVFFACVATATLVAWLPVNGWLRASTVVALGIYGVVALRHWALRATSRSIVSIELGVDHRIVLTERGGRRIEGVMRHDSYVGAALTTVVMRPDGARWSRATAILPDMLTPDDFRRLRVLLRQGQAAKP